MGSKYKISLPDGTEYVVNDVATIQRLYREGRITRTLLIQPLNTTQWRQLDEMFDLSSWQTSQSNGATDNAGLENANATSYGFHSDVDLGLEKPSSRGIRVSGFLLLINAMLNFLSLILIATRGFNLDDAVIPILVLTIDIVGGMHLLRGEWRSFAIVRMGIGAVVVGLIFPLYQGTPLAYVIGVLNLVFCGGFFILLYHEHISIIRTIVGASTVTFSWLAIIAASFLLATVPYFRRGTEARLIRSQIAPYTLPNRHYDDKPVRAAVDLPKDWILVKPNNPVLPMPQARMLAIQPESDCHAGLIVEYASSNSSMDTIDDFFGYQEPTLKRITYGFTELSRDFVHFGVDPAKRMEASWMRAGVRYHGWFSVCKVGNYYYELSGWCTEGNQDVARAKYEEIEKLVVIRAKDSQSD